MEYKVGINKTNDLPLYMYVLVNDDLKMGKGKIAGQVGHVVGLITEEIIHKSYKSSKGIPDCYSRYMVWKKTGHAKVVLKVTQEQIEQLIGEPESMYIIDSGKTQIAWLFIYLSAFGITEFMLSKYFEG